MAVLLGYEMTLLSHVGEGQRTTMRLGKSVMRHGTSEEVHSRDMVSKGPKDSTLVTSQNALVPGSGFVRDLRLGVLDNGHIGVCVVFVEFQWRIIDINLV